ncbi:MAG: hypothetical protein Q7S99_05570 [Parvibaculum sp.]|nr:hypothetical protein [Parvibaculum sp.]
MSDILDVYSRNARLYPALLVLLPLALAIAVLYPSFYTVLAGFVGIAVACGVTFFLAQVARQRGRRLEKELFEKWGGKPTALLLSHKHTTIDQHTLLRYHTFLERRVPNWAAPTIEFEDLNPIESALVYDSAVRWLLGFTRDIEKYPLVFKENISYGFRRNLLGLKSVGLFLSFSIFLSDVSFSFFAIDQSLVREFVVALSSGLAVLIWVFVIDEDWVLESANAYGNALLEACDRAD